jgi:hypothetical protein
MKELARTVKTMREVGGHPAGPVQDVNEIRQRMTVIKQRLDIHNRLEEEQAYTWPALVFDAPAVIKLRRALQHELENLPRRFA